MRKIRDFSKLAEIVDFSCIAKSSGFCIMHIKFKTLCAIKNEGEYQFDGG